MQHKRIDFAVIVLMVRVRWPGGTNQSENCDWSFYRSHVLGLFPSFIKMNLFPRAVVWNLPGAVWDVLGRGGGGLVPEGRPQGRRQGMTQHRRRHQTIRHPLIRAHSCESALWSFVYSVSLMLSSELNSKKWSGSDASALWDHWLMFVSLHRSSIPPVLKIIRM